MELLVQLMKQFRAAARMFLDHPPGLITLRPLNQSLTEILTNNGLDPKERQIALKAGIGLKCF